MESKRTANLASLPDSRTRPDAIGPSDRQVKATVVRRLRENPYTEDFRIRVDVQDGLVHLGGQVASPAVRRMAADDAHVVPGVLAVANDLVVAA